MFIELGVLPKRSREIGFPDSIACCIRYWRIDSGMASQSSPVSMLFLAISFIFARLGKRQVSNNDTSSAGHLPILKPDLYGSFGHINVLSNTFPNSSSGCCILIKFDLQGTELVLRSSLPLLILLLLCEGALPRWSTRCRVAD